MKFRYLTVALLCFAFLFGCAALQERSLLVEVSVKAATLKVIEQGESLGEQALRAQRIVDKVSEAQTFFDKESATIATVVAAVRARLEKEKLSPSDQLLVDSLVELLAAELQARIGAGLLSKEQRLMVRDVLEWVLETARPYALLLSFEASLPWEALPAKQRWSLEAAFESKKTGLKERLLAI